MHNENSSTVFSQQTATSTKKTQGKLDTNEKKITEQKVRALGTNLGTPKGHQDEKTPQHDRPTFPQARCQQGNQNFRFHFKIKIGPINFFKTKIEKFQLVEKIGSLDPFTF